MISGVITAERHDHGVVLGREAFVGQRVHHDDGVDGQQADCFVVELRDLRGDGREVGGVLREVDRIDLEVEQLRDVLQELARELQRWRVRQHQARALHAARLDRGDARHAERDPADRRVRVRVRQLERRGAVHEDGRELRRGDAVVERADLAEDRERPVGRCLPAALEVRVRVGLVVAHGHIERAPEGALAVDRVDRGVVAELQSRRGGRRRRRRAPRSS